MLAEERFALILEQLNEQRTVTVQQLCEALHTSESTIRRDLTELDRQGRLTKVHGGATLPDSRFLADEPTMEAKETLAVAEKRSIAAAAAALIAAEDFVFIDAGTTTLELVRALTCGAQSHLCDQWRGARPAAGAEGLSGVSSRRAAAPPDRSHRGRSGGQQHPAI